MKADLPAVRTLVVPKQLQPLQPYFHAVACLLHKRPHWQAINQPSRPCISVSFVRTKKPVPKPSEDDCCSFTKTGRDVDQLGTTRSASAQRIVILQGRVGPAGEPALIRIGLQALCCLAED